MPFFFKCFFLFVLWYLMCEIFQLLEKLPLPLWSDVLPQMLLYFSGVCYFAFCWLKVQSIPMPVPESLVSQVDNVLIDLNWSSEVLHPRNSDSDLKQDRRVLDSQTLAYALDFTEDLQQPWRWQVTLHTRFSPAAAWCVPVGSFPTWVCATLWPNVGGGVCRLCSPSAWCPFDLRRNPLLWKQHK